MEKKDDLFHVIGWEGKKIGRLKTLLENEMANEENVKTVEFPSYAKIGKGFVYMLKKDSPYPEYKRELGMVRIGHLQVETGRLIPDYASYYIYVDRDCRLEGYEAYREQAQIQMDYEKKQKEQKAALEEEERKAREEKQRKIKEDPFNFKRDFSMNAHSLVVQKFFEDTKIEDALVAAFGQEDATRIKAITGIFLLYGPIIMDFSGVDSACLPREFFPVLEKENSWDLCERICEKRDAFLQEMLKLYPDASLTVVPIQRRMEIIYSDQLDWEYKMDAYFRHDTVILLSDVMGVMDRESRLFLGVLPIPNDEYMMGPSEYLRKTIGEERAENLKKAGFLTNDNDHFWDDEDYKELSSKRSLTVNLHFSNELRKLRGRLEKMDPGEGYTGLPGNVTLVLDHQWEGIDGRLLLGLNPSDRKSMRQHARSYMANLKKRLQRLSPSDIPFAYGGTYFRVQEKEDGFGWSLVQDKPVVDRYKEDAGFYAIFTTDKDKTADELVWDHYEMQFIQDYYVEAQCRSWEWVGFEGNMNRVMEGMLLLMVLAENLSLYWLRRLVGSESYQKHDNSVNAMFKDLEKIVVDRDKEEQLTISPYYDRYMDTLHAFGFTREDVIRYAERLCSTPGYFDEKIQKYRDDGEREEDWLW